MKVIKAIDDKLELFLMGICLIVMTLAIFMDIVLRTATGSGLIWAQELSRMMTIFMGELGISFGIYYRKHIRVDIFETFVPQVKTILGAFADILSLLFCAVIAFYGITKLKNVYATNLTTPVMEMPSIFLYGVTELGLVLGVIRCIERNVKEILSAKKGKEEAA